MGCNCGGARAGAVRYPKRPMIVRWKVKPVKFVYQMQGVMTLLSSFSEDMICVGVGKTMQQNQAERQEE